MQDGLLVVCIWLFEPEEALDFLVRPERVCDAAHESKSGRPRSGLSFSYDFFHESFIFSCFPIVQWRILHDLPACEPDEGLRAQETA